jgi:HSP20 family protein
MAEKRPATVAREDRTLTRRDPYRSLGGRAHPFDRFAGEIDRLLDDFGFGRASLRSAGRAGSLTPWQGAADWSLWTPEVEVFQRNNEVVVRADLPGLKKEDVTVDVTDDAITIAGERREEHEQERAGTYQSERRYGSFCRVLPLPAGAIGDQAKATFKNGVLEITMPAPPEQVTRGRRLEIAEGGGTTS